MARILCMCACAAALAVPAPGEACSKRHQTPYELLGEATLVVEADVKSSPGKRGGPVDLEVVTLVKGAAKLGEWVTAQESGTSCRAGFRYGERALVFLDGKGRVRGHYEGYLEVTSHPGVVARVQAFVAAKDDAARVAALVDAIDKGSDREAFEAAHYLGGEPALLLALDEAQRKALAARAKKGGSSKDTFDAVVARATPPGDQKPDALAAIIDDAKQSDDARAAAMERCEMTQGKRLHRYWSYQGGVADFFWAKLAEACRTGTPLAE